MRKLIPLECMQAVRSGATPAIYTPNGKPLLPSIDLSGHFGPIEDQGQLGSCTAFAGTQAYSEWLVRQGQRWIEFSELAQYWEERKIMGTVNQDSGAWGIDIIDVLTSLGAQLEQDDPYNISKFTDAPNEKLFANPLPFDCVRQINHANLLNDTLDALSNELSVLFGFTVFSGLQSQQCASTGILPMPNPGEQPEGGHEVVAVGYDQSTRMLKIRNSWGASWGQEGYFWMPYDYFSKFADDSSYVFLNPTTSYHVGPFPTDAPIPKPQPTPAPHPQPVQHKYRLNVGPVDEAQMAQFEQLGIKLHVPILKEVVK